MKKYSAFKPIASPAEAQQAFDAQKASEEIQAEIAGVAGVEPESLAVPPAEELGQQLLGEQVGLKPVLTTTYQASPAGFTAEQTSRKKTVTPSGKVVDIAPEAQSAQQEVEQITQTPIVSLAEAIRSGQDLSQTVSEKQREMAELQRQGRVLTEEQRREPYRTVEKERNIKPRIVDTADVNNLFTESAKIESALINPEPKVQVKSLPGLGASFGDLGRSIFADKFDPKALGLAIQISAYNTLGNLNKLKLEFKDKEITPELDLNSEFDFQFSDEESQEESLTLSQIRKDIVAKKDKEIDLKSYSFIDNAKREMLQQTYRMMGIDPNQIERDQNSESIFMDQVLQKLIDEKAVSLHSYVEPKSQTRYYYPKANMNSINAKTAQSFAEVFDPQSVMVKLASAIPTEGKIDLQFKMDNNNLVLSDSKGNPLSITESYLTLLGSIPTIVEGDLLNVAAYLASTDPSFIKTEQEDYQETYNAHYEMRKAIYKALGHSEEEANNRASRDATRTAEKSIETKKKKINNYDISLRNRLEDKDSAGNQKAKYSGWGASATTGRAQPNSYDSDITEKYVRAAQNFFQKAYITKEVLSPEAKKAQVNKLFDTLFVSKSVSRNGLSALDKWQKGWPDQAKQSVNAKIMWARAFITLSEDEDSITTPTFTPLNSRRDIQAFANLRRMTPPDLLKYYYDNEDQIISTLGTWGSQVDAWLKDPQSIPEINSRSPWMKEALDRDEIGNHLLVLQDAFNYMRAGEGSNIKLRGKAEIDANNSNIFIQAARTGNLDAVRTLGMALSTGDFDAWYDTAKNPDSFYKILGNNYEQVIENVWPDDFEKQKAFKSFFKEILEMGGNDKKLTRDLVVAGVYGLNPGVNSGSARKILTLFSGIANKHLINTGFYKSSNDIELKNDFLMIQSQNFNSKLKDIAITRHTKKIGTIFALNGEFDLDIRSVLGERLETEVGLMSEDFIVDLAFAEATNGMYRPPIEEVTMKEGESFVSIPSFIRKKSNLAVKTSYAPDDDGIMTATSSQVGKKLADGLSAIITQSDDASIMKLSVFAQNRGREVPLPNFPIHDANILNAASFMDHYIAYNMVAIPSVIQSNKTYQHLFSEAERMLKQLIAKGDKAKAEGKSIPIGTENSLHKAIFSVLDNEYEFNKKELDKNASNYFKESKQRKTRLLNDAIKAGWIPKDPAHPVYQELSRQNQNPIEIRKFATVDGDNFKRLVSIVAKLKDVMDDKNSTANSYVKSAIDKWERDSQSFIDNFIKTSANVINSQN